MDSAGNDTLTDCLFHFFFHYLLPHASFHPHFSDLISCFSHPDPCSDKLVVFRVFAFWAVSMFYSYLLDLLLQLTPIIHINLIFFSFSACMLYAAPTSSSISSSVDEPVIFRIFIHQISCVIHSFCHIIFALPAGFME